LVEAEVRTPYREGGVWLVRPDGYVAVAGSGVRDAEGFLGGIAAGA